MGYHIAAERFSPHNFGIPQIRERVYIVGSLKPLKKFVWPKKSSIETSIDRILDDHPANAKKLSPQVDACLNVWADFLKLCPTEVELPSYPLWSMEWGATYPYEEDTPFALKEDYGIDGLKGFSGSHGRKLGHLRTIEERWMALPSHARTPQRKFPKWKVDFIRQNRQFYIAGIGHKNMA